MPSGVVHFVLIIVAVVMRLISLTALGSPYGLGLGGGMIMDFTLALIEASRRVLWNVLRVEHEQAQCCDPLRIG